MTRLTRGSAGIVVFVLAAACEPGNPCTTALARRSVRYSQPYAGHWTVGRADSLTLPQMGDPFVLTDVILDTSRTTLGRDCLHRGTLVFTVPAETLPVLWFGQPEQAIVLGWPASLGPFAGAALTWYGPDSLQGSILFDERMGVQVRPGVTARFWAGRQRTDSTEVNLRP